MQEKNDNIKNTGEQNTEEKTYSHCLRCGSSDLHSLPLCEKCLLERKPRNALEKEAAIKRNREIVELYHDCSGVITCSKCGEKVWHVFNFCPHCGRTTPSLRRIHSIALFYICIAALLIFFPKAVEASKRIAAESELEQIKTEVTDICRAYGLEVESIDYSISKNEPGENFSLDFYLKIKTKCDVFIGYKSVYDCLKELDKLRFYGRRSILNSGVYLSSNEMYVNGARYYLKIDKTLEKNGEHVYGTTKPKETTTQQTTTATTTKFRYNYGYHNYNYNYNHSYTTTKKNDRYNIKDYGSADDFYDEYWDDFDSYEDAEDYYDEYG